MRFSDTLSLMGLALVVVLLLHAARNGPVKPIVDALASTPRAPVVAVEEPAEANERGAFEPARRVDAEQPDPTAATTSGPTLAERGRQ